MSTLTGLLLLVILAFATVTDCQGRDIPKGYLILQGIDTYNSSSFGAISTTVEAEAIFSRINAPNYAVEFSTLYYSEKDLEVHRKIGEVARAHQIDLWGSSFRLMERVDAFGALKPEFLAFTMMDDGRIVPAKLKGKPMIDVLNPDAVDWFIGLYRNRYLEKVKGLISGYMFNEDALTYLDKWENNKRPDYWKLPVYSPSVLKQWRRYCIANHVTKDGHMVDKFPVHDRRMVLRGNGSTMYCPAFDVPAKVFSGQRIRDIPRAKGVWKSWYAFINKLYVENWVGRLAQVVDAVNADNPDWYGIAYFGLHIWSVPYEEVEGKEFTVPAMHQWMPWGRQRGADLKILSQDPHIRYLICETYPPISANLEYFIEEFASIAKEAGKGFGLMLHRDDDWKLVNSEEEKRWELIRRYTPTVLVRFPLRHLLPSDPLYSNDGEKLFLQELNMYRSF